jgi:two-component sensor histidine kinase
LARHVRSRLVALSRANNLTLSAFSHDYDLRDREVDLASLIGSVVASYGEPASTDARERIMVSGPEVPVSGSSVTHFALRLNELATNAAKSRALSRPGGTITIECSAGPSDLCVLWREQGGPALDGVDPAEGFGGQFTRTVIARHLGGTITRKWTRDGLIVRLDVPLANLRR